MYEEEISEPDSENPVELKPAWCWECADCSYTNFEEIFFFESEEEELDLIREMNQIPDGMPIVVYPKLVRCKKCGHSFGVNDEDDLSEVFDNEDEDEE